MTLNISIADADRRNVALRLLFSRFPLEEQAQKLSEALQSAERGSLNLRGLFLAEEGPTPVGATLMMKQPDGITFVWPPVVTCQASDPDAVENALLRRLCEEIDQSGSKLTQALLSPDDLTETELLTRHGFESMGEIFFVARRLTPDDHQLALPDGSELTFETYHESNAVRFESIIERTYEGSLDCPFLNGFRNGADALFSHKLPGQFDPAGWRLYGNGQQDIGVLLMNEHPDSDAIELVYFGISPEFRGQGLGRRVLTHGIQAAALTGRALIFLTVDSGNTYANSLYGELGFAELARRKILIRRKTSLA